MNQNRSIIQIAEYQPIYRNAFKKLNQEWIEKYFVMEAADHKSLDYPEENIINKGGFILFALIAQEVAGVCALIKMDHPKYEYELAKMAVAPKFQGKKIGWILGQAIIEKAQSMDAKFLFLESNTKLTPAINLYKKLGFRQITDMESPYERSNIQMELALS